MSTPNKPPQVQAARGRKWLLVLIVPLVLIAILILSPLSYFGYKTWSTSIALAAAEAEADQLDPGWRLSELLSKQPPIAEKDNSALHIIATSDKHWNFSLAAAPNYREIFKRLAPTAQLNNQQLKLIRDNLGKIAKPLDQARLLKDMPQGRFQNKYTDEFFTTERPHRLAAENVADWLVHDAYLLAHEKKFDEAIQSCRASLNAGRAIKDDLFFDSYGQRILIQAKAIISLERVLAQGEASEESLSEMQRLLEMELRESSWLLPVRGERAGMHMLFENTRAGKVDATYLSGLDTGTPRTTLDDRLADILPSTMLNHYPEYHRQMTECVEIAKLPIHEQRAKISAWEETRKASANPLISRLKSESVLAFEADCRSQTNLRTAFVALACERYRLQHKAHAWPATLDNLVKEKLLDTLPMDPIDGKPLRYRQNNESIVIYSIGLNGIDDGGNLNGGLDLGFVLWIPQRRAGG